MRRFLATVPVLLLLAALLPALAVAAQDDPATVVQRFFDARNRYDVAGTLALVTDDIRFVGGPQCTPASPCVGREAFRAELQNYIADRAQVTIVGTPQVSGPTVRARTEGRADVFRAAGVDRVVNDVTIEVRGGQLASHVGVPDASDPQTAQYLAYARAQQGRASLAVVERLLAALSAGDLDAALALVADNATIRYAPPEYGPPNNCCTGKAAIRGAYGALVAGKSQFTPVAPLQAAGDTVTGRIRQTGAGIRASGLEFVDADVTFTVRDGLMVAQVVAFTPETIAAGFRGLGAPPPGLPSTGGGAGAGTPPAAWLVTLACLGLGASLTAGVRRRATSRS